MNNKRIAFIYLQKGLTTVPCLLSFLELLSRNGYFIHIFSIRDEKSFIHLPNVRLHSFPGYYGKNFFMAGLTTITAILWVLWHCITSRERYGYIIGVHLFGLFAGASASFLLRVPLVYYNLEMYFYKELKSALWKLCKKLEICCSRRSGWIITLDRWHIRFLSKQHEIPQERFLILPNTSLGLARRTRSRLLHKVYGIPTDRKIILTMGSRFFDSKYRDQILEVSKCLPADFVLFVHLGDIPNSIKQKRFAANVLFGDRFIPYDSLNELFGSAHMGLVMYENENRPAGGRNQIYMGLSSGQFNLFMQCGVPCITTAQPTFQWVFKRYPCGIATEEFSNLPQLIQYMDSYYDHFAGAALRCYEEILHFEKYFEVVGRKFSPNDSISNQLVKDSTDERMASSNR